MWLSACTQPIRIEPSTEVDFYGFPDSTSSANLCLSNILPHPVAYQVSSYSSDDWRHSTVATTIEGEMSGQCEIPN